jgi:hypothetical protein
MMNVDPVSLHAPTTTSLVTPVMPLTLVFSIVSGPQESSLQASPATASTPLLVRHAPVVLQVAVPPPM